MSSLAPEVSPIDTNTMTAESAATSTEALRVQWRERIGQAQEARLPYEGTILSDLAFAAGQHWLVYNTRQRRMVHISEADPRYADRELYTADRITEYREAALAELESDDDRPNVLVVQDGTTAEEIAEHLNNAVDYAWNHEWSAEEILSIARPWCVDMGVAAIRCKWDPEQGGLEGHAPIDQQGNPLRSDEIMHLAEHGTRYDGTLPNFKSVRQGATCWEAYSALHILAPPGVTHERYFPWEVLARPVPIGELEDLYPHLKGKIQEDGDIANLAGVTTVQQTQTGSPTQNRLRGHAWLYTAFERPTAAHPNGLEVVLVSNQFLLADQREGFDYVLPDGTPHSGVVYLHWRRRSDRFWSGSLITALKDPQRIINRRETQNLEIIDRGMPRTYVRKGDMPEEPEGLPMEIVELAQNAAAPVMDKGTGPGSWMYEDLAHHADNLGHASTISPLRLGENPEGVDTYSQLALLNDNESSKRARTFRDHRRQIGTLVELGIYDIRKYWPEEKQILVGGAESQIESAMYQRSQVPDFYMVEVAAGGPAPRSQGALLKMLDAIWAAAVQAWVAVNAGQEWVEWYAASIKAGKPLDLPGAQADTQKVLAYYENQLMTEGEQPQVQDYDILPQHLPVHREAQDQARTNGDLETYQRLVAHIQDHIEVAQQNAAQLAATQAGADPTASPGQQSQNPPGAVSYQPPMAREPSAQVIPHAFGQLARGQ
jgi:hypothetical protein